MTEFVYDRREYDGHGFTSESIDYVGYNREDRLLAIQFKSGPSIYTYEGVSESTYETMIQAESVNAFWRNYISGRYTRGSDFGDWAWSGAEAAEQQHAIPVGSDESSDFLDEILEQIAETAVYGIDWVFGAVGPYTFKVHAASDAEAIAEFNAHAERFFADVDVPVRIVSVTRYFD